MEKKIVVVAGNRDQFNYWLRHNIIVLTSKQDARKLQGIDIGEVYFEGTYDKWIDERTLHLIQARKKE